MVSSAGNLQFLILQIIYTVIRYEGAICNCIIMANTNSDFKLLTAALRNNIRA